MSYRVYVLYMYPMATKHYVSPDDLRIDSFKLGANVIASGFVPDFVIALWRGGAPIAMYVQEILEYSGMKVDHVAIRTSKYKGVDQSLPVIKIHNLGYLLEHLKKTSKILVVDDISDTGHSFEAFVTALTENLGSEMPNEIKLAVIYTKPSRNKTGHHPDYFVHLTDQWVVFPHEITDLSNEEISATMGSKVTNILKKLHRQLPDCCNRSSK